MSYPLSLTQSQAFTALRNVLLAALPSGIEVIQEEDNLVPEPVGPDFVAFQPLLRNRLSTNIDCYQDCAFTGSIAGKVLTVAENPTIINELMLDSEGQLIISPSGVMEMTAPAMLGKIQPNLQPTLFGVGVAAGTQIIAQTGGAPGGEGTYTVSVSQTLASGLLAAGVMGMKQPTQLTVQIDVHGPNSADNAQLISTLMWSAYASDLFAAQNLGVAPLYADDPRQAPYVNAEKQVERVWTVDVKLQVNPIVYVPQQFFDNIAITVNPPADAAA